MLRPHTPLIYSSLTYTDYLVFPIQCSQTSGMLMCQILGALSEIHSTGKLVDTIIHCKCGFRLIHREYLQHA